MTQQLLEDLKVGDTTYADTARRLYDLGWRMPDCPDRWQVDRITGAILGAKMQAERTASPPRTVLDVMATVLVETVGLTKESESL